MTDKNGVGVTVISHDSENRTLVNGYESPGSYPRDIHYTGANLSQLSSLTEISSQCEQFFKYECHHSPTFECQLFGWKVSQGSLKMACWGRASAGSGKCACEMTNPYANHRCCFNCDKNYHVGREDSGLLTDKTQLPVIQLRFRNPGGTREKAYHTLGKLKCYGIAWSLNVSFHFTACLSWMPWKFLFQYIIKKIWPIRLVEGLPFDQNAPDPLLNRPMR